jgi:hypothetical protein
MRKLCVTRVKSWCARLVLPATNAQSCTNTLQQQQQQQQQQRQRQQQQQQQQKNLLMLLWMKQLLKNKEQVAIYEEKLVVEIGTKK